ncbi:hypothetical protein QL093DRAFT_2166065 [Fusarium oxysporum]|nr:hypothetical protein QL093DRAFT_2166065 [Fusarium oxysporum]
MTSELQLREWDQALVGEWFFSEEVAARAGAIGWFGSWRWIEWCNGELYSRVDFIQHPV